MSHPILRVHHILNDRFDALRPAQVQPDWPLLRLEQQCKREKGAESCSKVMNCTSTLRLRKIHDRIGGNEQRRTGHAETSNQSGAE